MTPLVSAVVLNWRNAPDTISCLASLSRQSYPHHVIVVENASQDDSVRRIRAAYPDIEILETTANLGYAGGNNAGIRYALGQGADYVFVVNNDATLAPTCLGELIDAALRYPQVGVVGGTIYDAGEPKRIQSAGMLVTPIGDGIHRGEGDVDRGQYRDVEEVDAVKGCAMLVSRAAVEAAGMLDERYYMYREEVDWCQRIRRAGFIILYAPRASIWHPETPPGKDRYVRATYYMTRNGYLLLKSMQAPPRAFLRVLARDLIWAANWTLNPKWRHKRRERDALILALRDAALGKWGYAPRWHHG